MRNFFEQKIELDALRHDREALEKIIDAAQRGEAQYDAVLFLPSVNGEPERPRATRCTQRAPHDESEAVDGALAYTNEFQGVKDLAARVDLLEKQSIPQLAGELLSQLKGREVQYETRIAGAGQELQSIPQRYIEEMRLRRQVTWTRACTRT
jgi:hypothetical protein